MKASFDRCSIRRVTPPRHVIVCGAGVVGASVAYFLSRRGVAVTIVERTGVACAASGKSGGFLALDWCDGSPLGPLARASFALHAELAREIPTDYGYRRMDTFMVAAREQGTLRGGHRVAAPAWLDGAGVVTAALGSTETTAQIHPARFTTALVDAACARGAARVSTALATAPIERRQACYRPVTDDGLPLIGRVPALAGCYVATGHGPWGMLNAPATGSALAELIVDGTASLVDLDPFDP